MYRWYRVTCQESTKIFGEFFSGCDIDRAQRAVRESGLSGGNEAGSASQKAVKAMKLPTIHLNGTPLDHLMLEVEEAVSSLRSAIDKLSAITVNGRDYYVQGPDAYSVAAGEHGARQEKLHSVLGELIQMHEYLVDKNDEKLAQKLARDSRR